MAELEDLSVSIQLTPFISADIIRKEKRVSIGKASKRTTEGYSFSLIPNDQVRKPIASAGRSIGRLLAARSVDLGFMRWSPRQFFGPLVTEISENQDVKDAKKAAGGIQDIAEHLTMMVKAFPHTAKKIAASISVQKKSQWSQERLGRAPLTRLRANSTIDEVRAVVQAYIIKRYKPFLSKDFVLSRLRRLSFEPIQFEFPLSRTLAADSDHGHKHFLACLVWACTDKLLRQGEDSGGRGRVFEYLDYRRRYNACRHGVSIAALAQQAASWMDPDCSLETAVEQFRNIYGSEHWTWDVLNLPAMCSV